MGGYKSILVGSRVKQAGKKRDCFHDRNGHEICKGDFLLEVREGKRWKGYCRECAQKMIQVARERLTEMANALEARKRAKD